MHSILVVRLGAMGDIIHALPGAASLKHSFPGARVTWVVEPQWAPLLEANGVRLHRTDGAPLSADASLFEICNDFERRIILERLEQFSWSQTEAAESLHVPLSTLNQKIKRLDIKIRKKSDSA